MSILKAAVRQAAKKAGRPKAARGVKPATPEQKMGAKAAGITVTEFKKLPEAQQKKFIKQAKEAKKPKKKKQPKVKRTAVENKELRRLTAQQKKIWKIGV